MTSAATVVHDVVSHAFPTGTPGRVVSNCLLAYRPLLASPLAGWRFFRSREPRGSFVSMQEYVCWRNYLFVLSRPDALAPRIASGAPSIARSCRGRVGAVQGS